MLRADILRPFLGIPSTQKIEIACKCASLPSEHQNTIVCLVDRDERTNKLVYLNQSERISGTVDPTFKKKFPLTFVDTSAKTLRFNVYDVVSGEESSSDETASANFQLLTLVAFLCCSLLATRCEEHRGRVPSRQCNRQHQVAL